MGHFLNAEQHRILQAMDIPVWVARGAEENSADPDQNIPDQNIDTLWDRVGERGGRMHPMSVASDTYPNSIRGWKSNRAMDDSR